MQWTTSSPEAAEAVAARRVQAVVMGASAGGFEALDTVLAGLPADFGLPIVAVLHLPEGHDSRLAELFAARLEIEVREARDKEPLRPGVLYFAPAGYHLSIEDDRSFSLSGEERVNYARPSIDVLMQSAAHVYGAALCGILLTGANHDGARGLAGIRLAGGIAIVQEPDTADVRTMPEAALRRMTPDLILPLAAIRGVLLKLGIPAP